MALEIGIVGLPGAGKTTIFNALTGAGARVGEFAGAAGKEHVGMAPIEDERLQKVAEAVSAKMGKISGVRMYRPIRARSDGALSTSGFSTISMMW